MTEPTDITSSLSDLNAEDRVFQIGDSFVKVKVWHDTTVSVHGREVFRASGAMAGADGKALVRESGPAIFDFQRVLVVQSETESDVAADIQALRLQIIEETLKADATQAQIASLIGAGVGQKLAAASVAPAVIVQPDVGAAE